MGGSLDSLLNNLSHLINSLLNHTNILIFYLYETPNYIIFKITIDRTETLSHARPQLT